LAISTIERKYRLQGILKHVSMSAGEWPQLPKPTGTTLQGDCGLRDVTSRQLFGGAVFSGPYTTFRNLNPSPLGVTSPHCTSSEDVQSFPAVPSQTRWRAPSRRRWLPASSYRQLRSVPLLCARSAATGTLITLDSLLKTFYCNQKVT